MDKRTLQVLDRPDVLAVLFHPRREVGVPRLGAGIHSVRIPVADNVSIGAKIFVAEPNAPVVLYFHGNGEIASDYEAIAPFYAQIGVTLFVFDFRGYGTSDGMPTATALLADARACLAAAPDVLAEHGLDNQNLYVMGRSLGSAAAVEVADVAGNAIKGLILESGFSETFALIERIGFVRVSDADESRDGFGNLDKIRRITMPTLIIHGERDWIIPVEDGRALYDASAAQDKDLLTIPGASHNDLMLVGRAAYFSAIATLCGTGAEPA